jgi:hypothetical protein
MGIYSSERSEREEIPIQASFFIFTLWTCSQPVELLIKRGLTLTPDRDIILNLMS